MGFSRRRTRPIRSVGCRGRRKLFDGFMQVKGMTSAVRQAFLQPRDTQLIRCTGACCEQTTTMCFPDQHREGLQGAERLVRCERKGWSIRSIDHEEMEMDLGKSGGEVPSATCEYVQVRASIRSGIRSGRIRSLIAYGSLRRHRIARLHPRAFTESFAAYRPAPDVDMARYI